MKKPDPKTPVNIHKQLAMPEGKGKPSTGMKKGGMAKKPGC